MVEFKSQLKSSFVREIKGVGSTTEAYNARKTVNCDDCRGNSSKLWLLYAKERKS